MEKRLISTPRFAAGLGSPLLGGLLPTVQAEEVARLEGLVVTAERMLAVERR